MPGIDASAPRSGGDDLDRLIDEFDVDKILDDLDTQQQPATAARGRPAKANALGLDEEVEVKTKRTPIPKLDENLLLTDKGIPKLRRLNSKMKFKGKGHEFSDVGRMLNMYQLWLDDLYPRAKFADSLMMVEKAGHGKRMQVMRKEWINESKPRTTTEMELEPAPVQAEKERGTDIPMAESNQLHEDVDLNKDNANSRQGSPDLFLTDDEGGHTAKPVFGSDQKAQQEEPSNDEPPADELDALLAESRAIPASVQPQSTSQPRPAAHQPPRDEFADEMEAMEDMDMW